MRHAAPSGRFSSNSDLTGNGSKPGCHNRRGGNALRFLGKLRTDL
jgi:hypothetical protein